MALKLFTDDSEIHEPPSHEDRQAAQQLVDDYLSQATAAYRNQLLFEIRPKDYEAGRAILAAPSAQQVAIVTNAAARLVKSAMLDVVDNFPLRFLLSALLRKKLPFDRSSIESLLQALRADGRRGHMPPAGVVRALEAYIEAHGMAESIRAGLESLRAQYNSHSDYAEERQVGKRIEALLEEGQTPVTQFDLNTGEAWTDALLVELGRLDDTARCRWQALFAHCMTAKSSKPSKKWLKTAGELLAPIGQQAFASVIIPCLAAIGQPGTSQRVIHGGWTHHTEPTLIHDTHADLLRGLVWTVSLVPLEQLIGAVGDAAEMCFKKIPNVGPRSPKIGNACLHTLSDMNQLAAVAQISRIKTRAKHASIRKQLAKALERAAEKTGMSEADLEEIAVPTCGLQENGRYTRQLGDFTAELTLLPNGKSQLLWIKSDGAQQKSVPTAIKQSHAEEIKALKHKAKEIDKLLPAQRARIEQLLLSGRSWKMCDFRQRLFAHPLVGVIARRMIWRFTADHRSADGIWHQGKLVDWQDRELDWVGDQTDVTIWHPIFSESDDILRWREWLEQHEICQPLKQAHREIYILTDAERNTRTYSNRFAAHIIRQHQFAALCQQRGWRYSLEGAWDSANTPYLELPQWGLRAEYLVEPLEAGQISEMGIFLYMLTGQFHFSKLADWQPVALADVPALVFSEVLRDLDLFVGVASIGNDPYWAEGGPEGRYHDYWQQFAFGDLSQLAQTRKEVLQRLVPRLKIADRCSFEDKSLVVRGDLHTYKIHLGSGNVLMTPNGQYLCIVPQRRAGTSRTDNLFLPFDGDDMLSVILSKAFLLAEDTKIKDDSILSQIRR